MLYHQFQWLFIRVMRIGVLSFGLHTTSSFASASLLTVDTANDDTSDKTPIESDFIQKNRKPQLTTLQKNESRACEKAILERLSGHRLHYLAKSNSVVAKAERRLEPKAWQSDSGHTIHGWKLSTNSRWMFINISEVSEFTWPEWKLQTYEMERKGLSKSKNYRLERNKSGELVLSKHKSTPKVIKLQESVFDPLNYQLRMQLDLACQPPTDVLAYSLVKRGAEKSYRFKTVGTETVQLEAGNFDSLLLEKIEDKLGRKTLIWFAKDFDYTLLKLEHVEKGRVTVLELKEKPTFK